MDPGPTNKSPADVVQFSSVAQKKVALSTSQGREEIEVPEPQVGLDAPPGPPGGQEGRRSTCQ
jgi:hypothetical protein